MEISTSIDRGAVVDEVIDIDLDFSTDQLHDSEDNDYIAEKENSIIPQQCSVEYSARDVRDDNTTINGHSLQDMGASASGREDDLGDAELAGQGGNGDMEPISTSTDGLNRFAQPRGNYMQIQDQDNLISPTDQRYSRWPDYINTYERQISDVLPLSAATPAAEFHDGQNLRDISSPFRSTDDIEQELVQISVPSELDPGNESLEMSGSTWDVTPSEDASVAHIPPSLVGSSLVPRDESEPHQTDALEVLTYLHPVIVIYQDNEMSLFPPINQDHEHSQTYFLDNESYASESIGSLLSACRTVLAESIEEEEELQIMIHKMGLCISEVSSVTKTALRAC